MVDRVIAGESLVVTRDGRPVAELRPLGQSALTAEELIRRWQRLPNVDPQIFRADVDAAIDPAM